MTKINHKSNTRDTFKEKLAKVSHGIHKTKYVGLLSIALLAASCKDKVHTPEYIQAKAEQELAKAEKAKADEKMKNAEDYEKAIDKEKEEKEEWEKAQSDRIKKEKKVKGNNSDEEPYE